MTRKTTPYEGMNERGKVTENQLICSSVEDLDLMNWISWGSSVLGSKGWNTSMAHSKFAERTLEGRIRTWRTKWSQQFLERRMLGRRSRSEAETGDKLSGKITFGVETNDRLAPKGRVSHMSVRRRCDTCKRCQWARACKYATHRRPTDLPHACILELVKSLTKKVRRRVQGCRTGQRQE